MTRTDTAPSLHLFHPPYDRLIPLWEPRSLLEEGSLQPGSALFWDLSGRWNRRDMVPVSGRPPGMSLILMLPTPDRITEDTPLEEIARFCRPQVVLPFIRDPEPEDLADCLAAGPEDLPHEVVEYLRWRGVRTDRDTRRLIQRTVELSREVRTVERLSRSLYMSRRALGRRFLQRGLPVPSHWLQVSRLLRATIRLQNSSDTLFEVAYGLGYPDGFSLSNQMHRLIGVRPSQVRDRLGWEWVLETWLRKETAAGALTAPMVPATRVQPGSGAPLWNPRTERPRPQERLRVTEGRNPPQAPADPTEE